MATIECTYGPVTEEVGGVIYEFLPDQFGRYVAEVWIDKHAKVFLAVVDHYRAVNKDNTDPWVPGGGNPPPTGLSLDVLSPDTAEIGSEDVTLHCYGNGFTAETLIIFNGGEEPTVFVSSSEVTTIVKPSTASVAGSYPVLLRGPDGGESRSLDFSFTEAPLADLEQLGGDDENDIPLTDIIGVGPALETRLQKAGVGDVRALAKLNKKELAALDEELGLGGRSARDDWLGQAKKLAR